MLNTCIGVSDYNGSHEYLAVNTGAEPAAHSSKIIWAQSLRRLKRLQTLHDEE